MGGDWEYEPFKIPYVSNYIPDFVRDGVVLEAKGVLNNEGKGKLQSVVTSLGKSRIQILMTSDVSAKARELIRELQKEALVTIKEYPAVTKLCVLPQCTDLELARLRKARKFISQGSTEGTISGLKLHQWCRDNGIPSHPVSYKDFDSLKYVIN